MKLANLQKINFEILGHIFPIFRGEGPQVSTSPLITGEGLVNWTHEPCHAGMKISQVRMLDISNNGFLKKTSVKCAHFLRGEDEATAVTVASQKC